MTRAKRQKAQTLGLRAEALAAWSLRLKGWRILDQRVRTGAGEIDLVALRGEVLAFVEVKARATLDQAAYAITPRQRGRVIRAASLWRARRSEFEALETRFDVILIAPWRWPRHIQAAFMAEDRWASDQL